MHQGSPCTGERVRLNMALGSITMLFAECIASYTEVFL